MIDLMNDFIFEAVANLSPNAIISHTGTINSITWISVETAEPTTEEVTAEVTRLQAEYDANQYQRDRKAKYDALNQLELISDDAINGTTTHKDAILAIKAEIPKETI